MGFVVNIISAVMKYVDVLAWLFPLVYPLRASVRAMESAMNSETQKLVAYWILLSLILLFEHAFAFLLKWLPLWPHVKLLAFLWLAIPNFDCAFYIYNLLVHPCLSFDPKIILEHLSNRKKSYTKSEDFLHAAERYVEENGPEALEKLERLIANKLKCSGLPVDDQKEIRGEATGSIEAASAESAKWDDAQMETRSEVTDGKELATTKQLKFCGQPDVAQKEIKEEVINNKELVSAEWPQPDFALTKIETEVNDSKNAAIADWPKPDFAQTEIVTEVKDSKNAAIADWPRPDFAQTEIETEVKASKNAAIVDWVLRSSHLQATIAEPKCSETSSNTVAMGLREPKGTSTESTAPNNVVRNEWTCDLCQITCSSERNILSHLQGRKHKSKETKLKQPVPSSNAGSPASASKAPSRGDTESSSTADASQRRRDMKQEAKVQDQGKNPKKEAGKSPPAMWCDVCQKNMPTEAVMTSHLNGRKHLARVRLQAASARHGQI